jgi:hypothetical protein
MLVDNEYQKYHPFGVGVGITFMILGFYHPAGVGCGVRIISRNITPLQGWCLDWDFNSFYNFSPFQAIYRITYLIPKG